MNFAEEQKKISANIFSGNHENIEPHGRIMHR